LIITRCRCCRHQCFIQQICFERTSSPSTFWFGRPTG